MITGTHRTSNVSPHYLVK